MVLKDSSLEESDIDMVIDELDLIEQFIEGTTEGGSGIVDRSSILIESSGRLSSQSQILFQRKRFDASFFAETIAPYVQLIEDLPFIPRSLFLRRKSQTIRKQEISDEQNKQAKIIFQELLFQGVERNEALAMMGPLRTAALRYVGSFSFREGQLYDPRFGLTNDGDPFML